jgi:hypothetical protein
MTAFGSSAIQSTSAPCFANRKTTTTTDQVMPHLEPGASLADALDVMNQKGQ